MTDETEHKSYSTGENKPKTFDIDGEHFTCHAAITGKRLWAYEDQLVVLAGQPGKNAEVVYGLFEQVMDTPEFERFVKYVEDDSREVPAYLLTEIWRDLLARYAGRPTGPSSGSARGRGRTKGSSKES